MIPGQTFPKRIFHTKTHILVFSLHVLSLEREREREREREKGGNNLNNYVITLNPTLEKPKFFIASGAFGWR